MVRGQRAGQEMAFSAALLAGDDKIWWSFDHRIGANA
jgi:hypothetical protein